MLPFPVHHVVWDIRNILPLFQWNRPTCGHVDMKVGIVMAGSSGGLENDDVSNIEFGTAAGIENIRQALLARMNGLSRAGWR